MGALTVAAALEMARRAKAAKRDSLPLKHFNKSEFGLYWPLMSVDLLHKLDAFREALGYPVAISTAPGAIGRPIIGGGQAESGAEKSWHNYAIHGEIMAIDLHPLPPHGADGEERQRWYQIAKAVGFTGIGIYPQWNRPGIHVDVRTDRPAGNPATWAGIYQGGKQIYTNINEAFV